MRARQFIMLFSLCIIVMLLMNACVTTGDRYREGDNKGQKTRLTPEDEKRMTQEVLPQMQKDYPPLEDPKIQEHIRQIGRKLITANKLEGNPYHYTFTVVDVDYVNAFALPAGTIFVTAPLILMASNEAEMAGVIGHEIGHVTARHTAERIDYMEKNKTKNLLYTIGGGILGGASGYGLGKLLCPDGDKECLAKAAGMGVVAGAGGSLLIQKYKFMANSREDEMEADRIGFRVAVNAGYSKADVGKFYEKLLTMEKKHAGKRDVLTKAVADALSTHPPSEERVQQMKEMAMKSPSQVKPIRNTHEFTQTKDRVGQFINSKKK